MKFSIFAGSLALVSIMVLGCVAPKDNTAKEKSSYVLSMKNKMGRLKGRSRLYAYRLCGTIEMHISMTPYPCPLLIGYLSLKQGAGAKTGTDGRTFYLWYDKESVLYKVPSTIIREDFNPNSLISQ